VELESLTLDDNVGVAAGYLRAGKGVN